jgi:colanic acid biosynthesis glycosyl transferase WcaI
VRIAIVSQYYAPEAIRIPDTLAKELVARGHEVKVVTGYPNYPDGILFDGYKRKLRNIEIIDGVQVRRVPLYISHSYNPLARIVNYLTFAWSAAALGAWVRSVDVVYVYATQMTPAIGPSIWRYLFRTPYVLHIEDLWPESVTGSSMVNGGLAIKLMNSVLRPWLWFLYRTAAATVAIAPSMARMLVERGVPANRIHTVFNWSSVESDDEQQEAAPGARGQDVSVVYAGNLGDHQDLDNVILAANEVKHISNLRITIVGSGVAEERLRSLAQSLHAHNVAFIGRVAAEEMAQIHAASDFEIVSLKDLPIFDGTIPSKLQSSLAHGVPVITTVRGDLKHLVEDNGVGLACDPGDVAQLALTFSQAAAMQPDRRRQMGRVARKYYVDHMSMSIGIDKIEKILIDVARPSRGLVEH